MVFSRRANSIGFYNKIINKKTCPLEIERLQTLPDNYTEFGMDENGNVKAMPKTRRFEAIGNGWTVDVIAHILSFMKL